MDYHRPPGSKKEQTTPSKSKLESDRLYSTAAWKGLRSTILASSPVCRVCILDHGIYTEAKVVDHIDPHRGDEKKFWDKDNLQPLCKPCHDAKTALETRSAPIVPQFNDTHARVVLVCGPPGSGRLAYAKRQMKPGDTLADVEQVAQDIAGVSRYEAEDKIRRQAYGQVVTQVRQHIRGDSTGTLYACLELPQATARKDWKAQIGERCRVVVIAASVDEVAIANPEAERLALRWWKLYTRSSEDEIV